jgi:hypothetical protein
MNRMSMMSVRGHFSDPKRCPARVRNAHQSRCRPVWLPGGDNMLRACGGSFTDLPEEAKRGSIGLSTQNFRRKSPARKNRFPERVQRDLACPVLARKIIGFAAPPNQIYIHRHPVPLRGAFRERHGRGAGCGGRDGALDGRCQRGRRRRVVLTPRRWCQVGGLVRRRRWQESPVTGESAL